MPSLQLSGRRVHCPLCSGWGEGLDNVNTPQIGSSWPAAMQLGYPDILRSFQGSTLSPCLVLNSQLPQLMLAVRVVARGDGGFSPTSPPTYTAHHREVCPWEGASEKSGQGDAADHKQRPKCTAPPLWKAGLGWFFLMNNFFFNAFWK